MGRSSLEKDGTTAGGGAEAGTTARSRAEAGTTARSRAEAGTTARSRAEAGTTAGSRAEAGTTARSRAEAGTTAGGRADDASAQPPSGPITADSGSQEALLGAIERMGFLEWRLEQQEAELATTRQTLIRHRVELAEAGRREADSAEEVRALRKQLARALDESARLEQRLYESEATRRRLEVGARPVTLERLASDYARLLARSRTAEVEAKALCEANQRAGRLQAQLDRFFERLIQWQHASASDDPDAVDLMELIAELRGETLRLESAHLTEQRRADSLAKALVQEAPSPSAVHPASAFVAEPRTPVITIEDARLTFSEVGESESSGARRAFEHLISERPASIRASVAELKLLAGPAGTTALAAVVFSASDVEARIEALRALASTGGPVATLALEHASSAFDWRIRAAVVEGWLDASPGAERVDEALRKALSDPEPRVRRKASRAALAEPSRSDDLLVAHLDDEDAPTRRALAAALAERGDLKNLFALSRLLDDTDVKVRKTAARALDRHLGSSLAVDVERPSQDRQAVARAVRERLVKQTCSR